MNFVFLLESRDKNIFPIGSLEKLAIRSAVNIQQYRSEVLF